MTAGSGIPLPDGDCFYCARYGPVVRDHFVPKSLGGGDGNLNRVDACRRCDRLKGNLHPWDWLKVCPPAGQDRVRRKMLALEQTAQAKASVRPRSVRTPGGRPMSPRRDPRLRGPSTSDGPRRRPTAEEVAFEQASIERWLAAGGSPMPPPAWSRYALQQPPASGPRSLRDSASRYLELQHEQA